MADIPIPFMDEEVDTDEGVAGIAMTVGGVIAGFAVLTMAQQAGSNLFAKANSTFTEVTGWQLTGSQDNSGPGGV